MPDDIGLIYKRQEIYWILVALYSAAQQHGCAGAYLSALQDVAIAFGIRAQLSDNFLVEIAHEANQE